MSSMAALSVPWQEACTSTERSIPSFRCRANSVSFGASTGV
jgi:hypothetical protein